MQIIPVLDLKGGLVVHATGGDRSRYYPVHHHSSICGSSKLNEVLACFLNVYPFQTVYIADLDAIGGTGNHDDMVAKLQRDYPRLEIWVDNGSRYQDLAPMTSPANCKWIIGSESQAQPISLKTADVILSLDFKHNQALGHPGWQVTPDYWPDTIIVMTLDLVGSNMGPDFEKLNALCQAHPDKRFIAAGGVRDIEDLSRLKTIGVAGVLLASALHNGNIQTTALEKF